MMAETSTSKTFARIIEHFTAPTRTSFESFLLGQSPGLDAAEAILIRTAIESALNDSARLKLSRVLLLELHAAQRVGELTADDDDERFDQFIEIALRPDFAEHLNRRYPALLKRLSRALDLQRRATEALVTRLVNDRTILASLLGQPAGKLKALSIGQGDLHAGGQTVARLSFEHGDVMYKPRSLRVDIALERFLATVFDDANRIRVPEVIDRGDYGWAEFVTHRYCENDEELGTFYRGLGHWLAVLRLLGGTDIHLENLIASGPIPMVIDVESLFTPAPEKTPSPYGQAYDLAESIIGNSVLRTGIVPFRAISLGYSGVDLSAAGSLPGQQPQVHSPVIINEGTVGAHVEVVGVDVTAAQNHPSPDPQVSKFWDHISDGFVAATLRLRQLDERGELTLLLAAFETCHIRDIRRSTQAYLEIGRMLWHPASLHDEAKAIERARDLFTRNAAVLAMAPSSPEEIAAEIDDLRYGDVPIFVAPLNRTRIDTALADWRSMRVELEELTIRSALVVTELNRGIDEPEKLSSLLYFAQHPHTARLDERRRKLATDVVERLLRLSVQGNDGSVTWITPETTNAGWLVQPLQSDVYFGLGGVLVALAGYQHEVDCGYADEVPGVKDAIEGGLLVLQSLEANNAPPTFGGLSGHGARIWAWLTLHDLLGRPEFLDRAIDAAEALDQQGFDDDRMLDFLDGTSGTIVPLCHLAEATGDMRWFALAASAAAHLEHHAIIDEQGARWHTLAFLEPIGGFAHGAIGISWALARLALTEAGSAKDRARWKELAQGGFAFQDSLYDEELGNWLDARQLSRVKSFHTWCNGSVGVGLAAADLYERTADPYYLRTLRRAVAASRERWGASHTLCHGDFSLWELFSRASTLDPDGCPSDEADSISQVVSAIEEHGGVIGGMTRAAFTPGLMTGLAGAVYSLSRMHPKSRLPSPLLLERYPQFA
ncbi:type 2 lanthipeptide synthetase LanM family protein [Dyella sp. 20L07]|uniref:type 2 lanthipeptide synthetase LanM family protein n=1 Tax=Dyella sp. 20L07 TaxID=3384240 RepID=UPI003D26AA62